MLEKIKQKPIKYGVIVGAVLVIILAGWVLAAAWNRPLGPALELNIPDPTGLEEDSSEVEPTTGSESPGTQAVPTEVSKVPTATVETVCGGPPAMTILVTGVPAEDYLYGLADAIRVVRVDFQEPGVTVLAVPRDLWVDIPLIADHGITEGKLNQAYFYGTEGMGYYTGGGQGSGLLAQTLKDNFGLIVDHYLSVNLNSFKQIIDTIGGIDVYLAEDIYRKEFGEPKLYLEAGSHHLNGKQAEMVARQRIKIGDFGRINNQTVILKGVAAKMLTPSGVKAIPDLVARLKGNVETDLSPADIRQLICLAREIDQEKDIAYEVIPPGLLEEKVVFDQALGDETFALVGDQESLVEIMNQFEKGLWP